MGWYGKPDNPAQREAERQRLVEARRKAEDEANEEQADRKSGAAYSRITVPFIRGGTGR